MPRRIDDITAMSRSQNWVFTLNNYNVQDEGHLASLVENGVAEYLVYGREVGENGTAHLQGFVRFVERKRLVAVRSAISPRAHLEVAKHPQQARDYCKKDGDFVEFGTIEFRRAGKRDEFQLFIDAVKSGVTEMSELREAHANVTARYPRWCQEIILDNVTRASQSHELRTWQSELKAILDGEPEDRIILFVVDPSGDKGKTWFAHWYVQQATTKCQVLVPGKKADMAFALDLNTRVLFVDAPRSKQGEFIQYDFLEEAKNGYVFSPKYESRMKVLPSMHVCVFMNEMPDMTKLSSDRYHIIEI
jgi:hypothetical protein